jgi:hypothetical protein
MDAEEIKKRLAKRPVIRERPQPKPVKLIQEEIDMIDTLTMNYSIAKLNDTEVVRAAIRALFGLSREKGLEVIFRLPKLKPGPDPTKKSD